MHKDKSPLAGKTVRVKPHVTHFQRPNFGGSKIQIEDWHDRVAGKSWKICQGNPACIVYAVRTAVQSVPVPVDDEVLYGHEVGASLSLGHLVHITEIEQ